MERPSLYWDQALIISTVPLPPANNPMTSSWHERVRDMQRSLTSLVMPFFSQGQSQGQQGQQDVPLASCGVLVQHDTIGLLVGWVGASRCHPWLTAKLQDLQCWCTGDTAVFHWAVSICVGHRFHCSPLVPWDFGFVRAWQLVGSDSVSRFHLNALLTEMCWRNRLR